MPPDDEAEIERLYRTRYQGFTAVHFHDVQMAPRAEGVARHHRPRASSSLNAYWQTSQVCSQPMGRQISCRATQPNHLSL